MNTAFDFSFAFSSTPLAPMDFVLIVLIAAAILLWLTSIEDEEPERAATLSCSWRRKFRLKVRRHKRSAGGEMAWSFGVRLGYWPCLRAPFVEGAFLFWRVQVWHGYADRETFARGDA